MVMRTEDTDVPMTDTEGRILHAAEREFLSKGFAGARTTSIAEAAGVTHAMLHYYFRTKEKLFDRIITEKVRLIKELFLTSLGDASLSLDAMIRAIISKHIDFISENPDLPRFIVGELFRDPSRLDMFVGQIKTHAPMIISILQAKIDSEADAGRCRRADTLTLLIDIVSLNVFPYMAHPLLYAVTTACGVDSESFIAARKEENYNTIMRKLRP